MQVVTILVIITITIAVARLRTLLASDPSIHGSKKPELSS